MSNKCSFSDCPELISPRHSYCMDHFELSRSGNIDICPICKKGKFSSSISCANCRTTLTSHSDDADLNFAAIQLLSDIEKIITTANENSKIKEETNVQNLVNDMTLAVNKFRESFLS